MRKIILFLVAFMSISTFANKRKVVDPDKDKIKIGVLDTGFGYHGLGKGATLCQKGHKDFTDDQRYTDEFKTIDKIPLDTHRHGTNIVGLIDKYAKPSGVKYCIVILKVYSFDAAGNTTSNINNTIEGINYATKIGIKVLNYSGGGEETGDTELKAIKNFFKKGGLLFMAAAGNDGQNLDERPYFPALDDPRVRIVGNMDEKGNIVKSSNYGNAVDRWEVGVKAKVFGITLTGTSQATAIATGKMMFKFKKFNN